MTAHYFTPEIKPNQPNKPVASWVIKNKETGEVIMETFDSKKVGVLNTQKYEAVPIERHLQQLGQSERCKPV
jgi:hypothetical protein